MSGDTHRELARFIWSICNLLRGPYKRGEYRRVILPMTVLRRFDCLLAPTKPQVLARHALLKGKPDSIVRSVLEKETGYPFYNLSRLDLGSLLDDPNQLAPNLNAYINGFSRNVRDIMERFSFDVDVSRMAEKNQLYEVVKAFRNVDLTLERIDSLHMGYVFEELIRIGAEQSNEEAGEHFTPREVIRLMVDLLLSPERDLRDSHVIKTIYDPACGTGGMLSEAAAYLKRLNEDARPILFGQDWNDGAWAVCKADMLIKGADADNIVLGDTFTEDGFGRDAAGGAATFDYMLANPPFGVEWKQQQRFLAAEAALGHAGRFGAGLPRVDDGALLFLQHMISKMRDPRDGGSRIGIVFSGSSLFSGEPGGGTSSIRQWLIENDWLEAVIALPEQLFYNTGIGTYVWILTNRKQEHRRGRVQLLDARNFWVPMERSLGNKRRRIGDPSERAGDPDHIADIVRIHRAFEDGEARTFLEKDGALRPPASRERVVSRVLANDAFGFWRIAVERPLRLRFAVTGEAIAGLDGEAAFRALASSSRKPGPGRDAEVAAGAARQDAIRTLLGAVREQTAEEPFDDRSAFLEALRSVDETMGIRLNAAEIRAVIAAVGKRDRDAKACLARDGSPEPDPQLRDYEDVPFEEGIDAFMARMVLPEHPDAWVDESKTKVGYEIAFTRIFHSYDPPRALDAIGAELRVLEAEIVSMLADVTA